MRVIRQRMLQDLQNSLTHNSCESQKAKRGKTLLSLWVTLVALCLLCWVLRPQLFQMWLLGFKVLGQSKILQAEQLLRKALARHPQSAVGWQRLGLVLRERNRGKEAMKAFQNAADYGNNMGSFLLNQADQLSLMGRLEEATALLAESCRTTPFDYDLHRAYAVALRALKDETSAEKHLRIATVLAPDSLSCWNLLSKCLARQGKWPGEKKASDKIYELESLYRPR